jgi:hypothetical protein
MPYPVGNPTKPNILLPCPHGKLLIIVDISRVIYSTVKYHHEPLQPENCKAGSKEANRLLWGNQSPIRIMYLEVKAKGV